MLIVHFILPSIMNQVDIVNERTKHGHLISISVGLNTKYEEIYTVEFRQKVNAEFKKEIITFANS